MFTITLKSASAMPYSRGKGLILYSATGRVVQGIVIASVVANADDSVTLTCLNTSGAGFRMRYDDILAGYAVSWAGSASLKKEATFSATPALASLAAPWVLGDSVVKVGTRPAILTDAETVEDAGLTPITWRFETSRLLGEAPPAVNGATAKTRQQLARLSSGEIYLKDMQDDVKISVYFRPDYSWDWVLWRSWTQEYSVGNASFCRVVGLGEPPKTSDPTTKRPWREGYHFQLAIEITGHCTLMGGRVYAEVLATPAFAPLNQVT